MHDTPPPAAPRPVLWMRTTSCCTGAGVVALFLASLRALLRGQTRSQRQRWVERVRSCPRTTSASAVAAGYDESSADMFEPAVVDPVVDFLADLAGQGAAPELASARAVSPFH